MEPYTTKILSKAKTAPYKYSDSDLTCAKAICEDRLFDEEYANLQLEVMRWQVQRWLWDDLFPHETDRFPGTKPRELSVVAEKEKKPIGLSVKIRKTAKERQDEKGRHDETMTVVKTEIVSTGVSSHCARCRSRGHHEAECTSKVLQERVLECSVVGHGIYIFGVVDGCPKCF